MTLPAAPVVTTEEVKALAGLNGTTDDALIDQVVAAVDEFLRGDDGTGGIESVRRRNVADVWPVGEDELPKWPERYRLGARMLAARLYRRKNSPEGVASFLGEGVAYVRRADPDVASLWRLNLPTAG